MIRLGNVEDGSGGDGPNILRKVFLNVKDDKVVENYLGRVVVINESHEVGATSREEVRSALKKMKCWCGVSWS